MRRFNLFEQSTGTFCSFSDHVLRFRVISCCMSSSSSTPLTLFLISFDVQRSSPVWIQSKLAQTAQSSYCLVSAFCGCSEPSHIHTRHCNVQNPTTAICFSQRTHTYTHQGLSQVNVDGQLFVFTLQTFVYWDETCPATLCKNLCLCDIVFKSTQPFHPY